MMHEESASASALYNLVRTLVTFAFGLALSILVPRWLGTDEYAVYSILITFIATGVALSRLSLDTTASRFVAEMRGRGLDDQAQALAGVLLRWEAMLCAAVCLALVVASPTLAGRYEDLQGRAGLVVLVALVVGPEALGLVLGGVLKGMGRYRYLARLSYWAAPATFLGSLAVLKAGLGVGGLVAVRALVSTARAILIRRHAAVRRPTGARDDGELRRRLVRFIVVWGWLMVVDMVVWEQSELYFLGLFWPHTQVALYALAFSLSGRAMALLPLAVGDVVVPTASRALGRAGRQAVGSVYRSGTRYLVLLSVPVAMVGIVVADPLVRLAVGAGYAPAIPLLRVLLASACVGAIGQASWAALTAAESRRFLLAMGTASVAVNISLDVLLIPRYAAAGAAAANISAQVVAVVVGAVYTCRTFDVSFPWEAVGHALLGCIPAGLCVGAGVFLLPWPQGPIIGVVGACLAYPAGLLIFHAVRPEDVALVTRATGFLPAIAQQRLLRLVRSGADRTPGEHTCT